MADVETPTGYLSIGEVLGLLLEEFPDVTISKIRFLESQGLIEPERTSSGYRKFYDADVERLRVHPREQTRELPAAAGHQGTTRLGAIDHDPGVPSRPQPVRAPPHVHPRHDAELRPAAVSPSTSPTRPSRRRRAGRAHAGVGRRETVPVPPHPVAGRARPTPTVIESDDRTSIDRPACPNRSVRPDPIRRCRPPCCRSLAAGTDASSGLPGAIQLRPYDRAELCARWPASAAERAHCASSSRSASSPAGPSGSEHTYVRRRPPSARSRARPARVPAARHRCAPPAHSGAPGRRARGPGCSRQLVMPLLRQRNPRLVPRHARRHSCTSWPSSVPRCAQAMLVATPAPSRSIPDAHSRLGDVHLAVTRTVCPVVADQGYE